MNCNLPCKSRYKSFKREVDQQLSRFESKLEERAKENLRWQEAICGSFARLEEKVSKAVEELQNPKTKMSNNSADNPKPFSDIVIDGLIRAVRAEELMAVQNQELREQLEHRTLQVKELSDRVKELEYKWDKMRNDFFLAGIKLDFELKNKK